MNRFATLGLALLATLLFCLLAYDRVSFLDDALTSDLLLPASFFWDLTHRAAAWTQFQLPRVPSFLPDLAVYGAVQLSSGSWRLAHFAYGLFALSAFALFGGWIVGRVARCTTGLGFQTVMGFSLCLLAVDLFFAGKTEAAVHFWLLLPVSHGGCFILSLATLCVAWSFLSTPGSRLLPLLFALQAIGVLSDKLFVIFFHIPFFLASALTVYRRELAPRRLVLSVAVSASAILAGLAVDGMLIRQPDLAGAIITWPTGIQHLRTLLQSPFQPLGQEAPFVLLTGFVLPIAGLLLFRPVFFRGREKEGADPAVWWWCVAVSAVGATLLVNAPIYWHLLNYRYMAPLLWWPLLWSAAAFLRWRNAAGAKPVAAALALLCCLFAGAYLREGAHWPKILVWRDPLTACVLEAKETGGLKAGIGDYWFARYLAAMSDWQLQIEQVTENGGLYYWGNDPYWYLHDWQRPERPPAYDFIVMATPPDAAALDAIKQSIGADAQAMWREEWRGFGLNRAAIETEYGLPARTIDCPGATGLTRLRGAKTPLWIYPSAMKTAFEQSSYFGARRLWLEEKGFELAPREFSGVNPEPHENSTIIRVDANKGGGWASWGPSFTGSELSLPPRPLRVTFSYGSSHAGRWQITADAGQHVLFEGDLPPTDGKPGQVETTIVSPVTQHRVDILTVLPGQSEIQIFGVRIDPIAAPDGR